MPGRLSTHALDIHRGRPAAGLAIRLFRYEENGERTTLKTVVTNDDGRTDAPLLDEKEMVPGRYELVFCIGAYFARAGVGLPAPPFLDEVPVRFTLADGSSAYHVPLIFSPWAYSTYRGS